jgi:phosphoglucosamine mutase
MRVMGGQATIFGTDGVRDVAGRGFLAPAAIRRLARTILVALENRTAFASEISADRGRQIWIGRDTRASGPEIFAILADEFSSHGVEVVDLGVLPTAGVAYCASVERDCCLAIVISASHNPAEYNGIKLIAPNGAKISPDFEEAVSAIWHEGDETVPRSRQKGRGALIDRSHDAGRIYCDFLRSIIWRPDRLRGRRIVIDAANGAAHAVAPTLFESLGMDVVSIGVEPNGSNINDGCGALHPQRLADRVRQLGAVAGFSFDGDADRMIPVTGAGRVLDGDFALALAGRGYARRGLLPRGVVVATVMSNIGLEKALAADGLRLVRTPVGDRYVYQELVREQHPIGGEQSGHLIFLDTFRTGDGLLAALRLLDVLEQDSLDLEVESRIMKRFPQILRNLEILDKRPIGELPAVQKAIALAEAELGSDGRVVVRYSGTEPLARVMIEGPDQGRVEALCDAILDAFRAELPVA